MQGFGSNTVNASSPALNAHPFEGTGAVLNPTAPLEDIPQDSGEHLLEQQPAGQDECYES